jgi:hypothetical protein
MLKATPQSRDARTDARHHAAALRGAERGQRPAQGLLAAGAAVNARDREGRTPLHMAAFSTRTKHATPLLEAGADPAPQDQRRARRAEHGAQGARRRIGRRGVAVAAQGLQAGQAVLRAAIALALACWPVRRRSSRSPRGGGLPPVVVYAPSPCLACIDWADHLRQAGFEVTHRGNPAANMPRLKRWLNVPSELESVHTATVGNYFIEGHVPAEDIKQLLKEMPKARGLAVPGLPRGSPGREILQPVCETACTILDNASQEREVRREPTTRCWSGPTARPACLPGIDPERSSMNAKREPKLPSLFALPCIRQLLSASFDVEPGQAIPSRPASWRRFRVQGQVR